MQKLQAWDKTVSQWLETFCVTEIQMEMSHATKNRLTTLT